MKRLIIADSHVGQGADDAAAMLRTCVAAARATGAVCVFLEPIALYATRDLHAPGDGEWSQRYPSPGRAAEPWRARVYGVDDPDLASFALDNPWFRLTLVDRYRFKAVIEGARDA